MPELPEVETTRAGLAPHLIGRQVTGVTLRRADLRWPIAPEIGALLPGQRIDAVRRRAKYLLLDTAVGSALLHLGMSGSLRVLPGDTPLRDHDHIDVRLDSTRVLRFNDPRRFGCALWQPPGTVHPLLQGLGPEPLEMKVATIVAASSAGAPATAACPLSCHEPDAAGSALAEETFASRAALAGSAGDARFFSGDYLFALSRGRRAPVKTFLMDQSVVVGVGNIYAAEALFAAGIAPRRPAGTISRARYVRLAAAVQAILGHAIARGGTTLRDFISPDGAPGYFEQELSAYGRGGLPCPRCGRALKQALIGQRASVWCAHCQR